MNIGAAIRQLRKQAGLNQVELAKETDMTQTYLSQIEGGKRMASHTALVTLAAVFDVPLAKIYIMAIGPEDIQSNDPTDSSIVKLLEMGKELILKAL